MTSEGITTSELYGISAKQKLLQITVVCAAAAAAAAAAAGDGGGVNTEITCPG